MLRGNLFDNSAHLDARDDVLSGLRRARRPVLAPGGRISWRKRSSGLWSVPRRYPVTARRRRSRARRRACSSRGLLPSRRVCFMASSASRSRSASAMPTCCSVVSMPVIVGDLLHRNNQRLGARFLAAVDVRRDDAGHLGVMVGRVRHVKAQHMRQHQRIRQAVRHMENAADRVRQRMHRGHRRIRERLAGKIGAQQHGLARFQVAAVFAGSDQVARQQGAAPGAPACPTSDSSCACW